MSEIIGNTIATPNPRPDWNQKDETKADYIKNKPTVLTEQDVIDLIGEHGDDAQIQSDWNQADDTKLDYIKNKPEEINYLKGVTSNIQTQLDGKALETHAHTKSDIGLSEVENKSSATIRGELTKENVTNALGYTPPVTDTVYDDTAIKNSINNKADKNSPDFTGTAVFTGPSTEVQHGLNIYKPSGEEDRSFLSMNRLGGSLVGAHSVALGYACAATSYSSIAAGHFANAGSGSVYGQTALGRFNKNDSNTNQYVLMVGIGAHDGARANGFMVHTNGNCYSANGILSNSGADFAEYFEWADGNPTNEDRRGRIVSLVNGKIELANDDDFCLGVISTTGAYIGNCAHDEWHGKYLTDVFGERLREEVIVPAVIDEETGEEIAPSYKAEWYILNPDYDPNVEYIPRENRKEWAVVGLLGQVVVVDDGTCQVGGYVKPSTNGIGTTSDSGYRVMKRIDENHIKVLVK